MTNRMIGANLSKGNWLESSSAIHSKYNVAACQVILQRPFDALTLADARKVLGLSLLLETNGHAYVPSISFGGPRLTSRLTSIPITVAPF